MTMENNLQIYNTLSRKKELFTPINPGHVGLYVCGPTVYGDAHLGHSRPAITFDILFRFLKHSGYKVRYVRNITDVGHLVNDADEGEYSSTYSYGLGLREDNFYLDISYSRNSNEEGYIAYVPENEDHTPLANTETTKGVIQFTAGFKF